MNVDTNKITRMDERELLSNQADIRKSLVMKAEQIEAPFLARIKPIEEEMARATAEVDAQIRRHDLECKPNEVNVHDWDDAGQPVRCVLSGLVILQGDEVVRDALGRPALRAVLPWPADPVNEDEPRAHDEAATPEAANG